MSPNGQKPPAFLFYAADFLTDTMAWSAEEVGAYLRLLCHAWINRSVPDDLRRMAAICGVESESFERLWHEVLSSKFHKTTYGLVNPRMEKERAALGSRKERAEKAAAQRWQKTSNGVSKGEASPEHMLDGCSSDAKPMPNGCLSSSSSSSSSKRKRGKRLVPESFVVTPALRKWAEANLPKSVLPLLEEWTARWIDGTRAKGHQYKDHNAAWRNGMKMRLQWHLDDQKKTTSGGAPLPPEVE